MKNYYVYYLLKSGAELKTTMSGNTERKVLLKAIDMLGKAFVNSQLLILNNIALDTYEVVAIEVREVLDDCCRAIEES